MRRMASNSNIKMGKASVFWVDGIGGCVFCFSPKISLHFGWKLSPKKMVLESTPWGTYLGPRKRSAEVGPSL